MTAPSTPSIPDLLRIVSSSTKDVFSTMVFMPVTPGESIEPDNHFEVTGFVSGTISLSNEDWTMNLSLLFNNELSLVVFRAMMGMEPDAQVNQSEVIDVVGELANMVAGGTKTNLQAMGVNVKIGLPTVVVGECHRITPPRNVHTHIVPMNADNGVFYVEIST